MICSTEFTPWSFNGSWHDSYHMICPMLHDYPLGNQDIQPFGKYFSYPWTPCASRSPCTFLIGACIAGWASSRSRANSRNCFSFLRVHNQNGSHLQTPATCVVIGSFPWVSSIDAIHLELPTTTSYLSASHPAATIVHPAYTQRKSLTQRYLWGGDMWSFPGVKCLSLRVSSYIPAKLTCPISNALFSSKSKLPFIIQAKPTPQMHPLA